MTQTLAAMRHTAVRCRRAGGRPIGLNVFTLGRHRSLP